MIRIRRAVETDSDHIATLWQNLMDEQHRLDPRFVVADDAVERWLNDFREWVDADDVRLIVVAEADSELVGFASAQLWWPPPVYDQTLEVYLDELYVNPAWRREGIGTRLHEAVCDWANEQEVQRIRLGTLARNDNGIGFWRKQGAEDFLVAMLVPFHKTSD